MAETDDREIERALVDILDRAGAADEPETLDRAIDLYLARFGDDQAARLLAIRKLTTALMAREAAAEQAAAPASSAARRR